MRANQTATQSSSRRLCLGLSAASTGYRRIFRRAAIESHFLGILPVALGRWKLLTMDQVMKLTRCHLVLIILAITWFVAGCATTPAYDALNGNPERLIAIIESGRINVNERIETVSPRSITPLCALLYTPNTGLAIDSLLAKGADVNMECRYQDGDLPLDLVIANAINRGTPDSPYRANKQYRPQDVASYLQYADKLLAHGAESKAGKVSMAEIKRIIGEVIATQSQSVAMQEAQLREKNAASKKTFDAIGKIATGVVAAGVVSNSSISDESKVQIIGAVATDLATDGKANATANLLKSPGPASTVDRNAPRSANPKSGASDQQWKQCGPNARCALGNGRDGFCSGPATGAPSCKEGCEITLGMFYHDTTRSKNAAYIPSTEKCVLGCTAVNSCD